MGYSSDVAIALFTRILVHVAYPNAWNESGDNLLALAESTTHGPSRMFAECPTPSIDTLDAAIWRDQNCFAKHAQIRVSGQSIQDAENC